MIIETCAALATRLKGIWGYLSRREERLQAVATHHEDRMRDIELENARNAGVTSIIETLARNGGGGFTDIELGGRSRDFRMPGRPLLPTTHQIITGPEQAPGLDRSSTRGELTP